MDNRELIKKAIIKQLAGLAGTGFRAAKSVPQAALRAAKQARKIEEQASKIPLAGSAGSLGAFMLADYLRSKLVTDIPQTLSEEGFPLGPAYN